MVEEKEHKVDDIIPGGVKVEFVNAEGEPIQDFAVEIKPSGGETQSYTTDSAGVVLAGAPKAESLEIKVGRTGGEEG